MLVMIRQLCVLLLLSVFPVAAFASDDIQYSALLIPDSLKQNAYSVVRLESNRFEYTDDQNGVEKVTRIVTILDEKGENAARLQIGQGKFWELKRFSGEVFDAMGKSIKKIKLSDMVLSSYSDQLATDESYYLYNYTRPVFPYTVKYEYEVKWKNGLILFPKFIPVIEYNQSLVHADYQLLIPASVKFASHGNNIPDPVKTTSDGKDLYTWKLSGFRAVEEEREMPEFREVMPFMMVRPEQFVFDKSAGTQQTWKDMGIWQWNLLNGRDDLPPTAMEKIDQIIKGATTDIEKAKRLYEYLQQSTRYVSIQLGIGGWQPIAASSVCKTGFGDCKGLSNYLKAMLKAVGINSYYTVISVDNKDFYPDFASLGQSNHVILTLINKTDTIPLECTSSHMPFGYIHSNISGHNALLVTPDGGKLIRLRANPDDSNRTTNALHITLDENALAQINVNSLYAMENYEDMLSFVKISDNDDRMKYLKKEFNLPSISISDLNMTEKKEACPTIALHYQATSDTYATKSGSRIFLPVNPLSARLLQYSKRKRHFPVVFEGGSTQCDSIVIDLPKGAQIETLPENVRIEKAFGSFTSTITKGDGKLFIIQTMSKRHGNYPASINDDLKEFIQAINEAGAAQIVLKTS
jgi:transglutaminase-like putative cysteine protease